MFSWVSVSVAFVPSLGSVLVPGFDPEPTFALQLQSINPRRFENKNEEHRPRSDDQVMNDDDMNEFALMCEERIFIASNLYRRYKALNDMPAARNQANALRVLNDQSATFRFCWQNLRQIPHDEFVAAVEAPPAAN